MLRRPLQTPRNLHGYGPFPKSAWLAPRRTTHLRDALVFLAITALLMASASLGHDDETPIDLDRCQEDVDYEERIDQWREDNLDLKPSFTEISPHVKKPALREKLINMKDAGQSVRESEPMDKEEMLEVDSANTRALKEIVRKHGWPTPAMVGVEGVDAAFLLLQHSSDLPFMKSMLPRLRSAMTQGHLKPSRYALLFDRIALLEGKPQRYGTQFECASTGDGRVALKRTEMPSQLAERRHKIGLYPIQLYACALQKAYKSRCQKWGGKDMETGHGG